jgi:hypothetical protein
MQEDIMATLLDQVLGDSSKCDTLRLLLEQDREEIRFWQERLFTGSVTLNAALLALAAFVLENDTTVRLRLIAAVGCVGLALFHTILAFVAENNVMRNGRDLTLIQEALGLTRADKYVEGRSLY